MASFFPSELGVRGTMRLPNRKEAAGARRLYRSTRVPDIVLRSNSATHRRTRFEIHEPVGEAASSPIPAWAGRRLNLYRLARGLSNVNPESLATGVRRFRAGVVDADVACEWGH